MIKFLELENNEKNDSKIDPLSLICDISFGLEELNNEFITLEILNRASLNIVNASSTDNKDFKDSFIELNKIFLGIEDIDYGTEENILKTIKNNASDLIKNITNTLNRIGKDIKEYFRNKPVKETKEKINNIVNKLKNKKYNKNVSTKYKKNVAEVYPMFTFYNGLKSTKDIEILLDYVASKESLDLIEYYVDFIEKDLPNIVDGMMFLERNNVSLKSFFHNPGNSKIKEEVYKILIDTIKNYKIPSIKQHPIKEKIINNYKKVILKESGIDKLMKKGEIDYSIIYLKENTSIFNNVSFTVVVFYRNKSIIKEIEKVGNNYQSGIVEFINNSVKFNMLTSAIGGKIIEIDADINLEKISKNIKPLTVEELEKIPNILEKFNKESYKILDKLNNIIDKLEGKYLQNIVGANELSLGFNMSVMRFIGNLPNIINVNINTLQRNIINVATKFMDKIIRLSEEAYE